MSLWGKYISILYRDNQISLTDNLKSIISNEYSRDYQGRGLSSLTFSIIKWEQCGSYFVSRNTAARKHPLHLHSLILGGIKSLVSTACYSTIHAKWWCKISIHLHLIQNLNLSTYTDHNWCNFLLLRRIDFFFFFLDFC